MAITTTEKIRGKYLATAVAAAFWATGAAITSACLSIFLYPISTELGIERSSFTIVTSIIAFVGMFMGPVWGQFMGKIGIRKTVLICGTGAALGVFSMSFCRSIFPFYAAAAVIGCFNAGATTLPASSLVANWFREKRGTVTSIVMTSISIGGVLGGLLLPRVLASVGWSAGFQILGIVLLCLTIPMALFVARDTPMEVGLLPFGQKETVQAAPGADAAKTQMSLPGMSFKEAVKNPTFYFLFVALFVLGIPSAFLQHANAMAMDMGVGAVNAGLITSIVTFGGIVFTLAVGMVKDKAGPAKTTIVFEGLYIVAWTVMFFVGSFASLAATMFFVAVGMSFYAGMPPIIIGDVFGPREFSKIYSMLGMGMAIGRVLGAPLHGLIYDVTGSYSLSFGVNICAIAIGAGLILISLRTKNSKQQDPVV